MDSPASSQAGRHKMGQARTGSTLNLAYRDQSDLVSGEAMASVKIIG